MGFFKYINFPVFIASLAIGIFFVYLTLPDTRKVYVYPNHDNIEKIQYQDATGTCFVAEESEVSCPKDKSKIAKVPIQS